MKPLKPVSCSITRRLLSVFLLTACACFPFLGSADAAVAEATQAIATLGDDKISVEEYNLYIRFHRRELAEQATRPSHEELVKELALCRVLAASAESGQGEVLTNPIVKWKLWEIEAGEGYTRIVEEVIRPKSPPSEEAVREYFQQNTDEFKRPGGFSFHNIFFDASRAPDDAVREALRAKAIAARAALEPLLESNRTIPLESFLRVASEAMEVPASNVKLRGPFMLDQIRPELEEAALALKPGQVSEVIPTDLGFYVIRLESVQKGGILPLAEVRPTIEERLSKKEQRERLSEFRKKIGTPENLTVHEAGLANLVRWATNPEKAENVMFAETGNFQVKVLDYIDYLRVFRADHVPSASETSDAIRNTHTALVRDSLLYADAAYQEATLLGFTSDATFENRLKVDRIAILGQEQFRRLLDRRLNEMGQFTDEQLQQYHTEHQDEFMSQPEYRFREIAIRPRAATNAYEMELAFREAEDRAMAVREMILSGSPEAETVEKYSQGEVTDDRGLTQWLTPGTRYSPEMWEEIKQLSKGDWMKKPYRLRKKATLLKVADHAPAQPKPLDTSRDDVKARMSQARIAEVSRAIRDEVLKANGFSMDLEKVQALPPLEERLAPGAALATH